MKTPRNTEECSMLIKCLQVIALFLGVGILVLFIIYAIWKDAGQSYGFTYAFGTKKNDGIIYRDYTLQ
jgi:hypothetical protein